MRNGTIATSYCTVSAGTMAGNFFRGTSVEQDGRWGNSDEKLMAKMSKNGMFAPILDTKVNLKKINLDVISRWVTQKIIEIVGFEDDILINLVINMLQGTEVDGKKMQLDVTGFLEKQSGGFVQELWTLLVDAQDQPSGIPSAFIQKKKDEILSRQEQSKRWGAPTENSELGHGTKSTEVRLNEMSVGDGDNGQAESKEEDGETRKRDRSPSKDCRDKRHMGERASHHSDRGDQRRRDHDRQAGYRHDRRTRDEYHSRSDRHRDHGRDRRDDGHINRRRDSRDRGTGERDRHEDGDRHGGDRRDRHRDRDRHGDRHGDDRRDRHRSSRRDGSRERSRDRHESRHRRSSDRNRGRDRDRDYSADRHRDRRHRENSPDREKRRARSPAERSPGQGRERSAERGPSETKDKEPKKALRVVEDSTSSSAPSRSSSADRDWDQSVKFCARPAQEDDSAVADRN